MYKLCLHSAWGMGCGGWRQQQSPELLLDHVPVGGRAFSMHCAEQAAIAQPAMGLWQQQSMRSGEGKVCSTEAEQMQSSAQRSWMLLLHCPRLSSHRQGKDNNEHGAGASTTEVESPSVDYSIFQWIWPCKWIDLWCTSIQNSEHRPLPPAKGRLSKLWWSYSLRSQMSDHEKSVNTWP